MTTLPSLESKNVDYALEVLDEITSTSEDRRAGSEGEKIAKDILLREVEQFCDETNEQLFTTHPGAGTALQKVLGIILVFCVVLFSVSVTTGYTLPSVISLILSLAVFAAYAHKFIFDETFLDFIKPPKTSANILGRRFSRGDTTTRVVITAHIDSPLCLRSSALGEIILNILFLLCIVGNTLLFGFQILFLFAGAPTSSVGFDILNIIAILFIPVYIFSVFIINPQRIASGISASLVPCCTALAVLKQMSDEGVRYGNTEVCLLFTGSEYSGKAGSYAFAKKHRRLFTDVPTIFISLEEITSTDHICVFFRDGSGTTGSREDASILAQAAENLNIKLTKESPLMGTASYTPFSRNFFRACSLGSSKKYIARTMLPSADSRVRIRKKSLEDVGALLLEALNYYDN